MTASRRRVLAGGGAVALGAALSGCTEDRSLEPGELTIISGEDESPGGQRHRLIGEWNQRHPDHPAQIIEVGGVADAHRSEMVARAQSGRPGVDVYNLDVTWIAEFVVAGYIRKPESSDLDTSGFLKGPLDTCEYEGELWALPFNTDAGLLYYRADLVPEERVPNDWGEIELRVNEVFGEPQRPGELVAGYAGQLADYEGLTVNALERIWAAGGEVMLGDWRDPEIHVEDGRVAVALEWLARAEADEDPQLILPQSVNGDETATTGAFREGKVVFMRNWPVAFRSLQAPVEGDSSWATGDEAFGVRQLPGPSVLGGQNLAIAAPSPRRRAAQALIEFLTSEPSQRTLFGRGGLPATRDAVYDDPAIVAEHRYAGDLRAAIRDARPRPVTPYYARFSEVFREGVRYAIGHEGSLPDRFADRLADAVRGLRR